MPEVEWLALVTETLADADRGELATLGLPTKEQAAVLSPTAPLCAPQHHTEAVLLGSRALARGRGRLRPRGPAPRRGRRGRGGADPRGRWHACGERPLRHRRRRRAQHRQERARNRNGRAGRDRRRLGQRCVFCSPLGSRRRAALRALPHRPSRHPERLRALGHRRRLGLRDRRGPRGFDRRAGADAPDPDRRRRARPAAADPPGQHVQVRR